MGVILNHETTLIDLCDSFDEDETLSIYVHPSSSLLLNPITFNVLFKSIFKIVSMPTLFFLMWWITSRQPFLPRGDTNKKSRKYVSKNIRWNILVVG